jgi:hypothetical protein
MTGGEFFGLLVLAIVAGIVTIIAGVFRLVYRLGDRGARRAWSALQQSSRSLFGPDGSPEELCPRLLAKHVELSPGIQGGLSFECSGCQGRLDFIAEWTEIRFQLDGRAKDTCEVSTASFMTQLAEEDPDAFRVRGNEELYRKVFADSELAWMLRSWRVGFEWSVRPAEFLLRIRALPRNGEELWRWLKGAYRLLEAVPGFEGGPSVQITTVSQPSLAESLCQICGASLGQGAVVYCRSCATPHHEDCWGYAGECSTFACKERYFMRSSST